ncbi:MAG: FtsX-like permease family protein, partial [Clostridiales bacterium]|nr:FtsX-like permease family protein [Clostridiales bacterium]
MRNPLNKRLPREFKKNAGKYIGIFLILITTIMLGSSFIVTMDSAITTLDQNDKECKIEDGQFETVPPISEDAKEQIRNQGVTLVENYYTSINNFDENAKLLVFNQRQELNLPSVFEGELPSKENEIAMERLFAKNRGVKVGDQIKLGDIEFTVTATIAVPDYSSLFKSNQDLMMNTTDFGISLTTKEGFQKFHTDTLTYRYSYLFNTTSLSNQEERELIEEMQKILVLDGAQIQSFLTTEQNQCITFLREDMGQDGPIMKVFIYLLIMIIAFVFAILTNNTIESEAPIIGTLRASGYTKKEIIVHYLSPTIIVAIVSSIVGNLLGYTVMVKPFEDVYYTTYCVPPMEIHFNLGAFITTTVVPVVIMILINYFMLYHKLSLTPLKFLRKDLKKKQKKALKLPNFSFLTRFRLRVLLQNKVNYLILFIGVFISSFLLMFGLGLKPLMDNYVDEIDDSLTYEYQYILKAPVEVEGGEKIQTYPLKTWFELGKTDLSVTFMGLAEDSQFFQNIELPDNKDEILITEPLAKKMNLKVGDTLTFQDEYYDKEYTLKVSAISEYKGSLNAFMKRVNLNELLGNEEDSFNSYLSNEELAIDQKYLAKYITRSDMLGAAEQMMRSFDGVIQIINIFSVAIYIILMYILTKTVIEKNALSISFMKVFGYDSKEINRLYLKANTITVIVSLLICIPVEILCFKLILVYLASMIEGY